MSERLGRVTINPEKLSKQEILAAIAFSVSLILEHHGESAEGSGRFDSLLVELLSGFTVAAADMRIARPTPDRWEIAYPERYAVSLERRRPTNGNVYYRCTERNYRENCRPESELERIWAVMEDLKTVELAAGGAFTPAGRV